VEHLPEGDLENLLESLGTGRRITLQEVTEGAKASPKPEGEVPNPLPGRRILDHLSLRHLVLDDPVREALLARIAQRTGGYVGSDLEGICREAGMLAMREGSPVVEERHFEQAIEKIHAMMNDNLREYYRRQREHFKGGLPKEVQPPEYQ
jgi:transitional endoplasmic reticulum ATPase